jgi:hypothetical protein
MEAIARRQVDVSLEARLQDRLDIDEIECVEPVRPLRFNKDVDVAIRYRRGLRRGRLTRRDRALGRRAL